MVKGKELSEHVEVENKLICKGGCTLRESLIVIWISLTAAVKFGTDLCLRLFIVESTILGSVSFEEEFGP